ncbi:MAG TPA: PhaM family polyhydroxyalkanoate granule multifunctional regulatory protein [Comamonas sp.]
MSDSSAFGFGKFIPGFDFLQNLGKAGTQSAGLPSFSHWIAPTVSVEEIDKRIEELKAVQFWLEQNSKALAATVQALEVQKMTLSTLKGMNVNLSELAKAFPFASAAVATPAGAAGNLSDWPMSAAAQAAPFSEPERPAAPAQPESSASAGAEAQPDATQAASMATAMQWWGALTQQFQQIAQQALQDPAQQQAMFKATQMSTEFAQAAVKTASEMVRQAVEKSPVARTSEAEAKTPRGAATTRKPAAKKASARKTDAKQKSAPASKASAKPTPARPASKRTR